MVEDNTPLYMTAFEGQWAMAEFLIAHRADVNARRQDGSSALQVANQRGHLELADLPCKNGARD